MCFCAGNRRYKSRTGRPPIPPELRALIRRMANENPLWGEERIANELILKLGIRVSPRTVRKYMLKGPPAHARSDQRWSSFLRNHAKAIVAWRAASRVLPRGGAQLIHYLRSTGNTTRLSR